MSDHPFLVKIDSLRLDVEFTYKLSQSLQVLAIIIATSPFARKRGAFLILFLSHFSFERKAKNLQVFIEV